MFVARGLNSTRLDGCTTPPLPVRPREALPQGNTGNVHFSRRKRVG